MPRAARALHVSFARDGTALFTGADGRLRLTRPDGRTSLVPGASNVGEAEISEDASLAVAVTGTGAELIDVATGRRLRRLPHPGAQSAAISRDNRRVATGSTDGTIRVWLAASGRMQRTLPDEGHMIALAFSPDAASVASASSDGPGRVWNVQDGSSTVTLEGDASGLTDISFSSDGEYLVTGSQDGTVRVSWADTGATQLTFSGHGGRVTSAAFSGPAGSAVVTSSLDGTARVWNGLYQPVLQKLATFAAPVTDVQFDGDGRIRVTTARGREAVLDPDTGETVSEESGATRLRQVVGPDGDTATIRGNTVVLQANGGTTTLEGHRDRVRALAFSTDGELLATASRDKDVRVWDVATGEGHPLHHTQAVHDVAFSADGRWLLTAAGRAAVWDPFGAQPVIRLQGHDGPVTAVASDPSGRTIVTGGADGTVRTYRCDLCGSLEELVAQAERRLATTGRTLTPQERERYLG